MLNGIPLKVPIERAMARLMSIDGAPARMINGAYGLEQGLLLPEPYYPHSLPNPVLGTQVLIAHLWPEEVNEGVLYDPHCSDGILWLHAFQA